MLEALESFPAVAILGPRQVGKTTLARAVAESMDPPALFLDLEKAADLNKLADPELFLSAYPDRLVVLDEIQRRPDLFPCLRVLIDQDRRPGRFLLLGSASPDLLRQSSETLAGRIRYLELAPLALSEIGSSDIAEAQRLWLRGGFPNAFLATSSDRAADWLEAFIDSLLTRDLPGLGMRVSAAQLRRFFTMVAHCHGQLWNGVPIAASLGVSAPTVRHYLDLMTDTFIARQLPPWTGNVKKRLMKSPKVYVRDSGILHRLLNIDDRTTLMGHPAAGASWEGFVIEQIIRQAPSRSEFFFYRTAAGAEIDLVIRQPGMMQPVAVEIKLSTAPKPERGFWLACDDLSVTRGYIVYPGHDRYPLKPGFDVLPLAQIAEINVNRPGPT